MRQNNSRLCNTDDVCEEENAWVAKEVGTLGPDAPWRLHHPMSLKVSRPALAASNSSAQQTIMFATATA